MTRRAWWLWVGQGVLALLLAVFVWRAVARNWDAFRALEIDLRVDPLFVALAAACVLLTYALLIEAWRRVLAGWGERLPFGAAAKIWCVSNLGRYVPGKIWSIAGLAVLARRAGVSGWSAAGSAVAMQALAVGTGTAVAALALPGALSLGQGVAALLVAMAAVGLLTWDRMTRSVAAVIAPQSGLRALSPATAVAAAVITLASWCAYGLAFWLLARGLLPGPWPGLRTAVGVFAAGYLVGLLALFAPGGVGVRELMFVGLLAPTMGSGAALALTLGSRLLLTATEVGAALGTMWLARSLGPLKEDAV